MSSGSGTQTTSSGSSYFFLQIATSSAPISEGGPIGGYWLPPTGEFLLATIALGFFTVAVKSREESEESMDSVGATLNLLDLTLLPIEEESEERPDSVLISGVKGRKDLKASEKEGEVTCKTRTQVEIWRSREIFERERKGN
ncbi:hypothetical protein HID58_074760 [Brassica napus]|uniref:Uncharacterized protein n=1 Tax=Brassica napus TaxID=3708 RepID=A0ABQ7YHR9_BRANA|nr:hypothetical protein HID58_074760 [Brassica napus]